MSGDEIMVLVVSLVITLVRWAIWVAGGARVSRLSSPLRARLPVYLGPLLGTAIVAVVLVRLAAHDVRDDPAYVFFYLVMGTAWMGVCSWAFPLLGLSVRDDVIERGNRAGGYVVLGAIVGISLCFAGGNIGDGPGWWVVVFSAGLASLALFALWAALAWAAGVMEVVAIDRDRAAGIRLGSFLSAAGLILGRSVAGDWASAGATVHDFVVTGWPVVVLLGVAIVLERLFRPTPERAVAPVATCGVLPGQLYLVMAAGWVWYLGWWDGGGAGGR